MKKTLRVCNQSLIELAKYLWIWVDLVEIDKLDKFPYSKEEVKMKNGYLSFDGKNFHYLFAVPVIKMKNGIPVEDVEKHDIILFDEYIRLEDKTSFANVIDNLIKEIKLYIDDIEVDELKLPNNFKARKFENMELTIISDNVYKIKFVPKFHLSTDNKKEFEECLYKYIEEHKRFKKKGVK